MGDYLFEVSKVNPFVLPKRRVFITYYKGDSLWVNKLISDWGQPQTGVFVPTALGVTEDDDFVDSEDTDYIISAIRERYLQGTSVTIAVIGQCTHSRKFVDWEIKSSLRQPSNGLPSGLIGIAVPPPIQLDGSKKWHQLPQRFRDNWNPDKLDSSYARYYPWPKTGSQLRGWIEEARGAVVSRTELIVNSQDRMGYNRECMAHGLTHDT